MSEKNLLSAKLNEDVEISSFSTSQDIDRTYAKINSPTGDFNC